MRRNLLFYIVLLSAFGLGTYFLLDIGALMNTRGLIELIVLNLGYDLGIRTPRVFAMMVIMALTTTFMTGPLLSLADIRSRRKSPVTEGARAAA